MSDRRTGIASQELPGALWQLVTLNLLDEDLPSLRALRSRLLADWFVVVADGQRLDQRGWPIVNDARLALAACMRARSIDDDTRRELVAFDARLDKHSLTMPPDEEAFLAAFMALPAELTEADRHQMLSLLKPTATEDLRRRVIDANRTTLAAIIATAKKSAYLANEGWLSYYVHRRLAAPATVFATTALQNLLNANEIDSATIAALVDDLFA